MGAQRGGYGLSDKAGRLRKWDFQVKLDQILIEVPCPQNSTYAR